MYNFGKYLIKIFFLILPELLFLFVILWIRIFVPQHTVFYMKLLPFVIIFILIVRLFIYFVRTVSRSTSIDKVRDILSEYKRGRFTASAELDPMNDLYQVMEDIKTVGHFIENLINNQQSEIKRFNEIYNNMIFSMSSFFLVMNLDEEIQYANDGFLKKFNFNIDDIRNSKIDKVFYFVNARIRGAIQRASLEDETVVLEKIHLLTLNKISVIANIKVTTMTIQGIRQIIFIIDDVTGSLRNDYHINFIYHISESMKEYSEIENLFSSILTGVTSGAGLGFNRAMLFTLSQDNRYLVGQLAVGPDSFEEAIEIWNSPDASEKEPAPLSPERGKKLQEKVSHTTFFVKDNPFFTDLVKEQKEILVEDTFAHPHLGDNFREFIDVKECVAVPMVVNNKTIGVIFADNKFNQVKIQWESIELLKVFCSQAAISIEGFRNNAALKGDMKRLEERQDAIIESEKMAAVGRIAAHIAHEIRNPLVTMGGYARRISHLSEKVNNGEKIAQAADIILKESERLEKTLSNVMDFTKPSKQSMDYFNINTVVDDTVELLRNLFLERKIELKQDLGEDLPLIKCDFNQMKQVILNLIQNSIDAMQHGGDIMLKTYFDREMLHIIVEDSGPGINEDDPNVIFEPFFTTKVTGVGLGLANVKKIIADHQGDITVSNREEGGVKFVISLLVKHL